MLTPLGVCIFKVLVRDHTDTLSRTGGILRKWLIQRVTAVFTAHGPRYQGVSQRGPVSGRSGSGACVAHLEKSLFPVVLPSRSPLGFSVFVGVSFTCIVGSVMEIITCTDKAWQ